MIGECMNFIRRRARLKWLPWCSVYDPDTKRDFFLPKRIKVHYQVTRIILFRNYTARHIPLILTLRGWGIAINSRPTRSTQWVLHQPVLQSETSLHKSIQVVREPSQFWARHATLRTWVWSLAPTLKILGWLVLCYPSTGEDRRACSSPRLSSLA